MRSRVQQTLLWALLVCSVQAGVPAAADTQQRPLIFPIQGHREDVYHDAVAGRRPLHGRFLWITDMHPDPFYKTYTSTDETGQCHRGDGVAGYYGAETASCDSPLSLINATFDWLEKNVADKVDFVIWTGDSSRHDNDEQTPRSHKQIVTLNNYVADRMLSIFGRNDDGFQSPKVIPTLGNNDIMPHNIMFIGPNEWTKLYLDIWEPFIPESQRHTFDMGGYFWTEVIPNRLAVFSLNTLYFFSKNAGVDGCLAYEQPGGHQFKWLRVQLEMMRGRGMKVILMGHVPPARTPSKELWDETCWQMYTLWTHQFRDIIIGSFYGHMDWDHPLIQDFNDVELISGSYQVSDGEKASVDDDVSVYGAKDYFAETAEYWADLPKIPEISSDVLNNDLGAERKRKKKKKNKHGKGKKNRKIGGPYAESFSLSYVSPSIIPSFFPTVRIFEYNITHIDDEPRVPVSAFHSRIQGRPDPEDEVAERVAQLIRAGRKPAIEIPEGPSRSSPPGPAYSPQTLTLTRYTQYFANLTLINNDFTSSDDETETFSGQGWKPGKHHGQTPKHRKPQPNEFAFEVEYDTKDDEIYKLEDLTVRSWIDLARRIGKAAPEGTEELEEPVNSEKKEKKKGKHRKHKYRDRTDLWLTFVRRLFVGSTKDEELMEKFDVVRGQAAATIPESQADVYEL